MEKVGCTVAVTLSSRGHASPNEKEKRFHPHMHACMQCSCHVHLTACVIRVCQQIPWVSAFFGGAGHLPYTHEKVQLLVSGTFPRHFPSASLSVLLTGNPAVGQGRARSEQEGLCLWVTHSLSPALGLIVPRTQTHPVGLVRRSDGNLPFQVSGLSNGPGGLDRALNRSWPCPSDYLARGG